MPAKPDTPAATYIAAAIPDNSVDHFVVLMTAPRLRPVVAASIALTKVIDNISQQETETAVRQLKLAWWLEETEMIARQQPRHPLSVELTRGTSNQGWIEPLQTLIRGASADLTALTFASLADLLPFCHRIAERQALLASVLPQCDERVLAHARTVGVGICLSDMLWDARGAGSRLPQDVFSDATASITAAGLSAIAGDHFPPADWMPKGQRRAQISLLLQARLYQRLLDRLRQQNFDRNKVSMRPLPLLWQAWREARNLLK